MGEPGGGAAGWPRRRFCRGPAPIVQGGHARPPGPIRTLPRPAAIPPSRAAAAGAILPEPRRTAEDTAIADPKARA